MHVIDLLHIIGLFAYELLKIFWRSDNECGYSHRIIDLVKHMAAQ